MKCVIRQNEEIEREGEKMRRKDRERQRRNRKKEGTQQRTNVKAWNKRAEFWQQCSVKEMKTSFLLEFNSNIMRIVTRDRERERKVCV